MERPPFFFALLYDRNDFRRGAPVLGVKAPTGVRLLVLLPLLAMMLGAEAPVGAVFFVEPMVLPIPSRARRGEGARRGAFETLESHADDGVDNCPVSAGESDLRKS